MQWLYANDPYLRLPYANNLGALIRERTFKENLKPGLFPKIRTVHKVGNLAVHDSTKVSQRDALRVVEELFHFLYWLCRYYAPDGKNLDTLTFDRNRIPKPADDPVDLTLKQLQELESRLSLADKCGKLLKPDKSKPSKN